MSRGAQVVLRGYPTQLAAIGDVAHPSWRASAVGALLAGLVADAFGLGAALWAVAALTLGSGLVVAARMRETLASKAAKGRARSEGPPLPDPLPGITYFVE